MEHASWYIFSLILGGVAFLMGLSVWSAWQRQQREETDPKELRYCRGTFLRRLQMAALMGLVAILLPTGPTFFLDSVMGKVIWVGAILLLVFWMMMMALADMLLSRFRYQRLQDEMMAARLRLEFAARQKKTDSPDTLPMNEEDVATEQSVPDSNDLGSDSEEGR